MSDPFVGRISLFRVLSGTVRPDLGVVNSRTRSEERLHAPFTLRGKEQHPVDELVAGDLGALVDKRALETLPVVGSRGAGAIFVRVSPSPGL